MPSPHLRLIIQYLNEISPDIINHEEPVRCPGCANTSFMRPTRIKITYDIICTRCRGVYSLTELVYKFDV